METGGNMSEMTKEVKQEDLESKECRFSSSKRGRSNRIIHSAVVDFAGKSTGLSLIFPVQPLIVCPP